MDDPDRATLYELAMRLLCVEHMTGAPMSYIDHVLAEHETKRRHDEIERRRRQTEARVKAYQRAKEQVELTGSDEPMDQFIAELRREHEDEYEGDLPYQSG
jgi:hypothetical protein